MIIANGKLHDQTDQDQILSNMESLINETLKTKSLSASTVIAAITELSDKISAGSFNDIINGLEIDGISDYIEKTLFMFRAENLEYKLQIEMTDKFTNIEKTKPPFNQKSIEIRYMPIGTLLHISAGNIDGLPVYSLIEGLLCGNVNILKLPSSDNGISVMIILKLIEIEPLLSDFIYVFDTPSSDILGIKKMADLADGIVVWGGDEAIAAIRQLAPVTTKLIEWGHKLSFAYISDFNDKHEELTALANHILYTKQLFCSSCQTIFIDTDNMDTLYDFCNEFLPYMEIASKKHPSKSIAVAAEISLRKYNDRLMKIISNDSNPQNISFQGDSCSLLACEDSELELSYMFGNCLVKRLPKEDIFTSLRKHKGYLQTVGLICSNDKREVLSDLFARCGLVRITSAGNMSESFCGEAHDGEYPLRKYTRIVNLEMTEK